jgi:limonene-1,2-epoxide hydrolase
MSSLAVVQSFIRALEVNNKKRILDFFDDQSIFTNVPVGSVKGRDEIWKILGDIHEHALTVKYQMHNIVADESKNVVLTERTDCYHMADRTIKFKVMGTFVVEGKIIREWRDYFDLKQAMEQMPEGTQWPE